MNIYTERKLNLLVYLAKVDGKFHKAEKALIKEFVNEKGFDLKDFKLLGSSNDTDLNLPSMDDKKEVLFLAIKLIQADSVINKNELDFCREMAIKLGYKAGVVDEFAHCELERGSFDKTVDDWLL